VLSYWGVGASEKEIAEKAHTTPSAGTSHSGMVAAARAYGMYGDSMYGSGITDLEMRIDRGMPVIVNFIPEEGGGAQAGPEPRYGHYSVVIGYDRDSLFMMDVDGGRERSMGKGAFESLWFSEMYGRRWMLVLYPWQHPGRKKVKPGRAG
jgi:predicted double-glycine peptidase